MIYVLLEDVPKAVESPVWLMRGKYGILRTPHRVKARGVLIDNAICNLDGKEPLGDCPVAKIITRAEHDEAVYRTETDQDPELTAEEALNVILGGSYESE